MTPLDSPPQPSFNTPPSPPATLHPLPGTAGAEHGGAGKLNWFKYTFTIKLIKEYSVIAMAVYALWSLLGMLKSFILEISQVFSSAVKLHSAPLLVVRTFDWHILLLGTALIVSISTILIVLLKSVLNPNPRKEEEDKKHLEWEDIPVGSFLSGLIEKFKR